MAIMKKFLQQLNHVSIEECLYRMSLILILGMAVLGALTYYILHVMRWKGITTCFLQQSIGIPCPGCGGTRAVMALMHGRVFEAVYYHAFAVYAIALYTLFFIRHTLWKFTDGKIRGMKYRNGYVVVAVILLVGQYILKLCIEGYQL